MLEHAKSYQAGGKGAKAGLPTLALAKSVVRMDESKYSLLLRFNISLDEFKSVDGRTFSYLKALADKHNEGLRGAELVDFAKE